MAKTTARFLKREHKKRQTFCLPFNAENVSGNRQAHPSFFAENFEKQRTDFQAEGHDPIHISTSNRRQEPLGV